MLDAAITEFARKGYPDTTIDDLIAAARMGVGSFYAHFAGKEQCLLAAVDLIVNEAVDQVTSAAKQADSWPKEMSLGLWGLLGWLAEHPAHGRVALVEVQSAGPAAASRYETMLRIGAEALRSGRKAVKTPFELSPRLEETAVAGVAWVLRRNLVSEDPSSLPALFPELGRMILEPYVGDDAARDATEWVLTTAGA